MHFVDCLESGGGERSSPGRLSLGDGEGLAMSPGSGSGGSPGSLKVPGAVASTTGGLGRIARLLVKDTSRSGEESYRRRTHSLERRSLRLRFHRPSMQETTIRLFRKDFLSECSCYPYYAVCPWPLLMMMHVFLSSLPPSLFSSSPLYAYVSYPHTPSLPWGPFLPLLVLGTPASLETCICNFVITFSSLLPSCSKNGVPPLRRATSIDSLVDASVVSASSSSHVKTSVLNMTKSNGHLRSYLPVSPALYKRPSFKFDKTSTSTGKAVFISGVRVRVVSGALLWPRLQNKTHKRPFTTQSRPVRHRLETPVPRLSSASRRPFPASSQLLDARSPPPLSLKTPISPPPLSLKTPITRLPSASRRPFPVSTQPRDVRPSCQMSE
ncbi:hypothetical protein O3P69_004361 [Scylla paramamosain]|uniref:Uncharacterized protein n=1 Tax=Scylla paramamosain TaxID=85552 RepID=A0AAW0UBQ3_SCYPA